MRRKKLVLLTIIIVFFIGISLSVSPVSGSSDKPKHASFSVSNWTGDWLPTYIPKILLEDHLGYTTEVVSLSIPAGVAAISTGEVSLSTIVWMPNNEPLVSKFLGSKIEDLGEIYPECLQAMFIPKWVSEKYGITSIAHLNKPEYAEMFDIDKDGKGDWLGCDPGWLCAKLNDECITLYGLDKLYVQMVGAEHFLTAAMEGQMKKNKPVLVSQFYPHVMFIDYPKDEVMVVLDDPKGFWDTAHVEKFANMKWVAENPKAAEIIRRVKITGEDVMWQIAQVRERGDDPAVLEAIAREWMAKNKSKVDTWLQGIE